MRTTKTYRTIRHPRNHGLRKLLGKSVTIIINRTTFSCNSNHNQNFDLQKARIVQVEELKHKIRHNPFKKPNLHQVRNHSNSPLKNIVSPKKEMFRSLYGHSFGMNENKPERGNLLSTLGMNSWRAKNKSLSKKEV